MDSFEIFFERRMRNPLRKKELADMGSPSNLEYVKQQRENLPPDVLEKIKKQEEFKVDPSLIDAYRQAKIKEHEKDLSTRYLRSKIDETSKLITTIYGIKIFVDKYASEGFVSNPRLVNKLVTAVKRMILDNKDIIPNRKPTIVVTDTTKNPFSREISKTGVKYSPAAFYRDRIIYIDDSNVDDVETLTHEYAHYLADRVPRQSEPILKQEYQNMLDAYFREITGKATKRKELTGRQNEKYRKAIAEKFGLPTPYAAVNFDEFFAEIISKWKTMPNNTATYKFKNAVKKVINRI